MKRPASRMCLSAAILSLAACGASPPSSPSSSAVSQNDPADATNASDQDATAEELTYDHVVTPPKEYYDAIMDDTIANLHDGDRFNLAGSEQTLYVNFSGAELKKGYGNGESFILCKQNATVPNANLSTSDQTDVLNMVQKFYNDAGAKLTVTGDEPSSGDYTTIHVGGTYRDLGCNGQGVLGIAPFDKGNLNYNDIGFAFNQGVMSNFVIAETVAHEAGHSFGLDHINNNTAVMYYASTQNIEAFKAGTIRGSVRRQDSAAILQNVLGEANPDNLPSPNPPSTPNTPPSGNGGNNNPSPIPGLPTLPDSLAGLPGLDMIGSIGQILPDLISAGGSGLDISAIEPILEALMGGATGVGGIGDILGIIGLASNAGQGGSLPIDLAAAQDILGGLTGGLDISQLTELLDLGKALDLGQALGGLSGIFGAGLGTTAAPQVSSIDQMPDLSNFLNISSIVGNDPNVLISSLIGSTKVVNANYVGDEREALLSLLKVAYSQAYETP